MAELMEIKQEMTLREIVAASSKLAELLAESNGELTAEIEAAFASIDLQTQEKIDGYYAVMKRMEMERDHWSSKAEDLDRMAKACDTVADRLKKSILFAMQSMGVDEIKGREVRAKLSSTKGRLLIDEKLLPQDWKLQEVKWIADKERVRAALENLEDIPGAKIEGGVSIRFYAKKAGD